MPSKQINETSSTKTLVVAALALGFFGSAEAAGGVAYSDKVYGFQRYCDTGPQEYGETADNLSVVLNSLDKVRIGDGECEATDAARQQAKALLSQAYEQTTYHVLPCETDCYFGEIGIEWRSGDRIVRLTCFGTADEPRIDYGVLSASTPGHYYFESPATAEALATKLDWLAQAGSMAATAESLG